RLARTRRGRRDRTRDPGGSRPAGLARRGPHAGLAPRDGQWRRDQDRRLNADPPLPDGGGDRRGGPGEARRSGDAPGDTSRARARGRGRLARARSRGRPDRNLPAAIAPAGYWRVDRGLYRDAGARRPRYVSRERPRHQESRRPARHRQQPACDIRTRCGLAPLAQLRDPPAVGDTFRFAEGGLMMQTKLTLYSTTRPTPVGEL